MARYIHLEVVSVKLVFREMCNSNVLDHKGTDTWAEIRLLSQSGFKYTSSPHPHFGLLSYRLGTKMGSGLLLLDAQMTQWKEIYFHSTASKD